MYRKNLIGLLRANLFHSLDLRFLIWQRKVLGQVTGS